VTVIDIDYGYKRLVAQSLKSNVPMGVTVGVHDSAGDYENGVSIAEVAAIHEFGLNGVQRSFLRAYIDANQSEIRALIRQQALLVMRGLSQRIALEQAGQKIAAGVRQYIQGGSVRPALDEQTILRKKSSTPLIDTGALVSAIDSEVK
jgi:hypothetical protein